MARATESTAADAVVTLLKETFEGPSGPSTYFIDNDPKAGFFAALGGVSSTEASREPWPGAATIAGHAHHAGFHLDVCEAWIRGDRADRDWAESWTVRAVNDAAWKRLRDRLRSQYEALSRTLKSVAEASDESLPTAISAVAHAAYHLGAIRQRIADPR